MPKQCAQPAGDTCGLRSVPSDMESFAQTLKERSRMNRRIRLRAQGYHPPHPDLERTPRP
jgi:hypothetical protein